MKTYRKTCQRCTKPFDAAGPNAHFCDGCVTPREVQQRRYNRDHIRRVRTGERPSPRAHQFRTGHPPLIVRGSHACVTCGRGVTITVTHDEVERDAGHRALAAAGAA